MGEVAGPPTLISGVRSTGEVRHLEITPDDYLLVCLAPGGVGAPGGTVPVLARAAAINATVALYGVPGGSTLYLTQLYISGENVGAGIDRATVRVYDTTPSLIHYWILPVLAGGVNAIALTFPAPIVLPAGYTLFAYSAAAALTTRANISGYLV